MNGNPVSKLFTFDMILVNNLHNLKQIDGKVIIYFIIINFIS